MGILNKAIFLVGENSLNCFIKLYFWSLLFWSLCLKCFILNVAFINWQVHMLFVLWNGKGDSFTWRHKGMWTCKLSHVDNIGLPCFEFLYFYIQFHITLLFAQLRYSLSIYFLRRYNIQHMFKEERERYIYIVSENHIIFISSL